MPKSIRVLLADGHGVDRAAVAALLGQAPGLAVVAQCGGVREAAALVAEHRPQVVIFEPWPGDADTLAAVQDWAARAQGCGLLALSVSTSAVLMARMLRRGVRGLVPKRAELDELVRAIGEVARGRRYLSPLLDSEPVLGLLALPVALDCDPVPTLTRRERQAIEAIVEGCRVAQTGERLQISPRTVEIYRDHAYRKLHLRDLAHVVRYGLARGLGTYDDAPTSPARNTRP